MSDEVEVIYRFCIADGEYDLPLRFDRATYQLQGGSQEAPEWARLEHNKCPHCPLDAATTPVCPFAAALASVISAVDRWPSFEAVFVEVVTEQRTISASTTLQRGLASAIGLISATSGCPHTRFFRPLARFHLPFATMDETLYRVFSMHLLTEYLQTAGTAVPDMAMTELRRKYTDAEVVNGCIAKRLRSATDSDAAVNAVIILNSFAEVVPFFVEEKMADLRYICEQS